MTEQTLSKRERQRERRLQKRAIFAKQRRAARVRRLAFRITAGVAGVAVVGFLLANVVDDFAGAAVPDGVQDVALPAPERGHTQEDVDYDRAVPAGGEHSSAWQNCGFYTEPVGEENATHSLEHGAVWVAYSDQLPDDEVEVLRGLDGGRGYLLISPVEGASVPVVATAWGKQLELGDVRDPRLEQFVRAFVQGAQTPEPGGACSGGVGEPS